MDHVYKAAKDDPEMVAAIKKARKTFPKFRAEADADLNRAIPILEDAMVKLYITSLNDPDVGEHLWARYYGPDPENEGRFRAVILNSPRKVADVVAKDDGVSFALKNLSDWLYVTEGKAHGAFTVRLLRSRMTPAELKKHDAAYPFSFEDGAAEPDAAPDRGGRKREQGSRSPHRCGG